MDRGGGEGRAVGTSWGDGNGGGGEFERRKDMAERKERQRGRDDDDDDQMHILYFILDERESSEIRCAFAIFDHMTGWLVAVSHPRLGALYFADPGSCSSVTRGLDRCESTTAPRWSEREVAIRHVYQSTGVIFPDQP